ncbi:MAG: hypothetical protein RL398_754 [Planctomycetota bacterium]|jgi:HEAT repeat protein
MFAFALSLLAALAAPTELPHHPIATAVAVPTAGDPLKAMEAWLKLYQQGKIAYESKDNIAKHSIAAKFDLTGKSGLGVPTWENDWKAILEAVAKVDNAEAAEALVEAASIGIAPNKLEAKAAPHLVRAEAERWAGKLTTTAAKEALAKAARGEVKGDKSTIAALQIAGVRCLAATGDKSLRATIEAQLGAGDELVRMSAADALDALGDRAAAGALASALAAETSDAAVTAICRSLRRLFADYVAKAEDKPKADPGTDQKQNALGVKKALPAEAEAATKAAIGAVGKTTWRGDMALVQLLDEWRTPEAIPALVSVLERYKAQAADVASGKLSPLLLYRTHELLVAMTGAVIPADQPDKWRELWEREKESIDVTAKHAPKAAPSTVASGFCGIPVQGNRVLFILDLSGSMNFKMPDGSTTRLDYAQKQLEAAMKSISENSSFNLVTFNGNPKAKVWSKDMVQATEKNREKFLKFVAGLRADGGTNLWSGFEQGLKVKSLVHGERYDTNVDEVFILSDGAPSVGDIIDPIEILRLVRDANRWAGMRVNTIFITSTDPAEAQPMPWMTISPTELMRRLASENGGKFIGI